MGSVYDGGEAAGHFGDIRVPGMGAEGDDEGRDGDGGGGRSDHDLLCHQKAGEFQPPTDNIRITVQIMSG